MADYKFKDFDISMDNVNEAVVNFTAFDGMNSYSGSIKFDGCSNWQFEEDCMTHFCGLESIKEFMEMAEELYRLAEIHIENWCDD